MKTIEATIKTCLLNGLYLCLYALMMPVILYRRIFKGRPLGSFRERFFGLSPKTNASQGEGRCVWLHAVSVGEVNLLETLLDRLNSQNPTARFVISTTTATGMKLAKQKYPEHSIFYFPIDFSWAIKNVLRRVKPDLIVLTELEVWPNLISIARRYCGRHVPVVVINGRLSKKSFRGYNRLRRLVRPTFARLDHVVAQTQEYAERFVALGCNADQVSVAGSVKFDGATSAPDPALVDELRASINLQQDEVLWVAGSTQEPEELMAARTWLTLSQHFPKLRLVIVPRHPERGAKIQHQLTQLGVVSRLRSLVVADQPLNGSETNQSVLIADTIGELTAWWAMASIAFVGGSFGDRGGQNMLEPAAMGCAVCFGPNTWNFKQIVHAMRAAGVGQQLTSETELRQFVQDCLASPEQMVAEGSTARQFVLDSQGAVVRTCDQLNRYFGESQLAEPPSPGLPKRGCLEENANNPSDDQDYRAA